MAQELNYIQLPLSTFLQLHPQYIEFFPLRYFHDPNYVVRLQPSSGTLEVGFPSDDWEIQ